MASGGKRQKDIRDFIKGAKATNKATGKGGNKANKPSNKMTPELGDELLTKISIHRGSITDLKVDCIVNAANGGLWAGAGVCGAIFRAAGYGGLQNECDGITDKLGNIPTGESVITGGYKLYAKHIIHSVGPTSQNNRALSSCYVTALDLCIQRGIRSIAFPCISTGIFGFSKSAACPLALKTVRSWLINAKSYKYKDYKKMIDQKQQMKIKEAIKRNKRGYGNYDSDEGGDDDDDEDEWEDDEDDKDKRGKNNNTDGVKNDNEEENNTKKDNDNSNKKEVIEIHNEEDINHETKEAEERENDGNDDEEDDDMDVDKQEDDKKGKGGVAEEKNDENKNNDTNNDKNDDEEENEETVFDRIDDIVFCCYDIGNWHLYQDETPEIFPSTNQDYNYLWSNKVKSRKKKAKKKEVKSDKKKENKDNKEQKPENNDNNDNNNDEDDDINDPMDIGGDSQ